MTTRKDFDLNKLAGGIMIDLQSRFITIIHQCDPWRIFSFFGFDNVMQLLTQVEVSLASESKNNLLRETIVSQPGVGPTTNRTIVETQIITNNNTQQLVQDSRRERDRLNIMLVPLIWIPAWFYSHNPQWRVRFTELAQINGNVPTLFVEMFKRTRHVSTDSYRILTGCVSVSFEALVATNPQLRGTFWDPAFLGSETGLRAYFAFLNFIFNASGNYIPFTAVTRDTLPPFESNQYITYTAYTTNRNHDFLNSPVNIIEHNMPSHHSVYAADAVIGNSFYTRDQGANINYTDHQDVNTRANISSSPLQWMQYICHRTLGLQPNDNGAKGTPSRRDPSHPKPQRTRATLPKVEKPIVEDIPKLTTSPQRDEIKLTPRPNFKVKSFENWTPKPTDQSVDKLALLERQVQKLTGMIEQLFNNNNYQLKPS